MNRRIPNGAWCLFRLEPQGSRQGKVVLVQHREIHDTDLGGHFTVKVYESEREDLPDGTWLHRRIVLRPAPMVFTAAQEGELRVIAELVGVLG